MKLTNEINELLESYDNDKTEPETIKKYAQTILPKANQEQKKILKSLIRSCEDRISERENEE